MTRKRFINPPTLAAVAIVLLAAVGLASPVRAQSGPMVIAVVDLQVILKDSKAATSANAAIERQNKAFQSELKKQEDALTAEAQQLEQQRAVLSAEDFRKKGDQLQQKVNAWRQTAASRRQQMQQLQASAERQVLTALNATVSDVAKARSISLVLVKGATLYSLPAYDITTEVLQKLDQRLPAVKLSAAQ